MSDTYPCSRKTAGEGHAEKKDLTITGEVAPGECVTVKQVVHNVLKTVVCDVELKISEDAHVPFIGKKKKGRNKKEKPRTTVMKRLLSDKFLKNKCVRVWKGRVEFHVRNKFEIESRERTLEVHTHESNKPRQERVALAHQKGCHNYANDMQMMSDK